MAANTVTGSTATGVITGTDPNFVVTYKTMAVSGVVLMVKYTKGTEDSVSITFDTINPSLHATDKYRHIDNSAAVYTMTFTATGNYRIPIELLPSEKIICANITFSAATQGGAVVANFMEA